MGLKILLNVLYNIGIIICLVGIYFSYQHGNWPYIMGLVFIGAMIFIFKLRLIKDIRNMGKNP
ncbi:DUF6358 family protein [uncultured Mucilaginibacter sp.]|uniref:DUF6358 family protein n=1 Tax=uncultured Mucilaginibacter sp. TaxID=797541 RepID=UPI0025E43A0D|nr:DUF6358 family protein [uncultured Mucilaginibacter sp.]